MIKEDRWRRNRPEGLCRRPVSRPVSKKGRKTWRLIYSEDAVSGGRYFYNKCGEGSAGEMGSESRLRRSVRPCDRGRTAAWPMRAQEKKVLATANRRQRKAAELFGIRPEQVLVASTGVIGAQIPIDKIRAGIETMQPMLGTDAGGRRRWRQRRS